MIHVETFYRGDFDYIARITQWLALLHDEANPGTSGIHDVRMVMDREHVLAWAQDIEDLMVLQHCNRCCSNARP